METTAKNTKSESEKKCEIFKQFAKIKCDELKQKRLELITLLEKNNSSYSDNTVEMHKYTCYTDDIYKVFDTVTSENYLEALHEFTDHVAQLIGVFDTKIAYFKGITVAEAKISTQQTTSTNKPCFKTIFKHFWK